MNIEFEERAPTVAEYLDLRDSVGWHALPKTAAEAGLANSLYAVCAVREGEVIGCGRITGDNGIYFYVQDLIIRTEYQYQGVGSQLMAKLMDYIEVQAQTGAFIGLMTAPGLERFYGRFGFAPFPEDSPGMHIWI
ncbi:MAG: GNAT family N-acetyltransferase [Gammaproteobacteria bacterium]|nr:GNAT family N-acetyltransferase [Gammaproteobacteria bacterium]